jgi:rubredoxin
MAPAPQKDKRALVFRIVVIAVLLGVVGAFAYTHYQESKTPDHRGDLAQCLTDKGVKMYGAYWCPHCAAQKKDFGSAFKQVSYVECAIPGDPSSQTQACKDKNITGYPTWIFPAHDGKDEERTSGEQKLTDLAEKAGCDWKP